MGRPCTVCNHPHRKEVDQALLNAQQAEMLNTTGAVDAAAFMELVGRAVRDGWIENGEMK